MKWFFLIFTLVGSGLLTGGFFTFQSTMTFKKHGVEALGKVIRNERRVSRDSDGNRSVSYYPIVTFTTMKGKEITFTSKVGSSSTYASGAEVPVLYLPDTPEKARIKSFFRLWFSTLILSGMGTIFFLIGFIPFCFIWRNERRRAWAQKHGRLVQAEITSIYLKTSYKVNGKSPWVVQCEWIHPTLNTTHVLKSQNLWDHPGNHLQVGQMINIKIDIKNPKVYWMDIRSQSHRAA